MALNAKPSVGIDCGGMIWPFTATYQHNLLTEVSQGRMTAISAKARITRCAMASASSFVWLWPRPIFRVTTLVRQRRLWLRQWFDGQS